MKCAPRPAVCGVSLPTFPVSIWSPDESQLQLVGRLAPLCQDVPWTEQSQRGLRYYFDNDYFCTGDALVLQSMLRLLRPRRFVEVGSGFSSALVLDTNDLFLGELACTFIDPDPVRLRALLTPSDHRLHTVIEEKVQEVDRSIFQSLEAGDFLFIDSSHVSKTGSDVNFLMLDVLPTLAPGVICHIHDIPPRSNIRSVGSTRGALGTRFTSSEHSWRSTARSGYGCSTAT